MANMTMKEELKWRDEQIEGLKKKLYAHVDRIAELESALDREHREQWAHLLDYQPHPLLEKKQ